MASEPIPTSTTHLAEFRSPELPDAVIYVRVPDYEDRQTFYTKLQLRGRRHHTREDQRNMVRKALLAVYGEGSEEEAFVEGHWQITDEIGDEMREFFAKIRLLTPEEQKPLVDEWDAERKANPRVTQEDFDRFERIAQVLQERYQPLMDIADETAEYLTASQWLSAQSFVKAWDGLPKLGRPETHRGALTHACVTRLRAAIGPTAWYELVGFIDELMQLSPDAEGNFVLPPTPGTSQERSKTPESSTARTKRGKSASKS